jgi:hypothetical protein
MVWSDTLTQLKKEMENLQRLAFGFNGAKKSAGAPVEFAPNSRAGISCSPKKGWKREKKGNCHPVKRTRPARKERKWKPPGL